MVYTILYLAIVLFFLYDFNKKKENRIIAAIMGGVLFLLVAFRDSSVGWDTIGYLEFFNNPSRGSADGRDVEELYSYWNSFWHNMNLSGQMYLILCAFVSVGLVLISIWKAVSNRIWAYTLFLVAFSWFFYMTGIRQSMSMGCFTYGTYLLVDRIDQWSDKKGFSVFNYRNILPFIFIIIAPLFHTTALYPIILLIVVTLAKGTYRFYLWTIIISFVICLSAVFQSLETYIQGLMSFAIQKADVFARYEGYAYHEYLYDTSIYMILKTQLPISAIAVIALMVCHRKKYDIFERLFFWLVITSNLFFYFETMYRMNMHLYPVACIALTNLLAPDLKRKQLGFYHYVVLLFVFLKAYVSYVNLSAMKEMAYKFFFQ